jgi:hypothetical protein
MVMTTGAFFKDMLSETGSDGKPHISSKRVMGTFVLIISQCCILYLTYRDGSTSVVENLLQTAMIMAASLLGISSITGIWKGNSMTVGDGPHPKPPTRAESANQ